MKKGTGRYWPEVELAMGPHRQEPRAVPRAPGCWRGLDIAGIEQSEEPCCSPLGILCTGGCSGPFLLSPGGPPGSVFL